MKWGDFHEKDGIQLPQDGIQLPHCPQYKFQHDWADSLKEIGATKEATLVTSGAVRGGLWQAAEWKSRSRDGALPSLQWSVLPLSSHFQIVWGQLEYIYPASSYPDVHLLWWMHRENGRKWEMLKVKKKKKTTHPYSPVSIPEGQGIWELNICFHRPSLQACRKEAQSPNSGKGSDQGTGQWTDPRLCQHEAADQSGDVWPDLGGNKITLL